MGESKPAPRQPPRFSARAAPTRGEGSRAGGRHKPGHTVLLRLYDGRSLRLTPAEARTLATLLVLAANQGDVIARREAGLPGSDPGAVP